MNGVRSGETALEQKESEAERVWGSVENEEVPCCAQASSRSRHNNSSCCDVVHRAMHLSGWLQTDRRTYSPIFRNAASRFRAWLKPPLVHFPPSPYSAPSCQSCSITNVTHFRSLMALALFVVTTCVDDDIARPTARGSSESSAPSVGSNNNNGIQLDTNTARNTTRPIRPFHIHPDPGLTTCCDPLKAWGWDKQDTQTRQNKKCKCNRWKKRKEGKYNVTTENHNSKPDGWHSSFFGSVGQPMDASQ